VDRGCERGYSSRGIDGVVYRAWRISRNWRQNAPQAEEERKAKLEARVDQARTKCKEAGDRAEARMDRLRQETEAKIEALQEQAAEAKADAKEKLDQRIAEVRADLRAARGQAEAGQGAD
jgi:hypothetical protein